MNHVQHIQQLSESQFHSTFPQLPWAANHAIVERSRSLFHPQTLQTILKTFSESSFVGVCYHIMWFSVPVLVEKLSPIAVKTVHYGLSMALDRFCSFKHQSLGTGQLQRAKIIARTEPIGIEDSEYLSIFSVNETAMKMSGGTFFCSLWGGGHCGAHLGHRGSEESISQLMKFVDHAPSMYCDPYIGHNLRQFFQISHMKRI